MASSSSAAAAAVTSQFIFIDGVNLFYRSAGPTNAPVVLALHTSPASSFSFRSLLSELGDSYRILAPDLPGSGFTEVGDARRYEYSFDSLSRTLEAFVDALNIKKLSLLVHGSGGPVGFRLALRRPELIHTVITCNAPISLDGLGPFWEESGLRSLWAEPTAAQYKSLQAKILTYEAIKLQYMHGEPVGIVAHLAPESYFLDYALLSRPGNHAIQLTLLSDFKNNLPLYRSYAWWIQEHAIPVLVLWGQRDQVVAPAGVQAFRKAAGKKATRVFLIDGGHMLFETHKDEVVGHIRQFLTAYKTAMHSDV